MFLPMPAPQPTISPASSSLKRVPSPSPILILPPPPPNQGLNSIAYCDITLKLHHFFSETYKLSAQDCYGF